jgi:hypothetical protein
VSYDWLKLDHLQDTCKLRETMLEISDTDIFEELRQKNLGAYSKPNYYLQLSLLAFLRMFA